MHGSTTITNRNTGLATSFLEIFHIYLLLRAQINKLYKIYVFLVSNNVFATLKQGIIKESANPYILSICNCKEILRGNLL